MGGSMKNIYYLPLVASLAMMGLFTVACQNQSEGQDPSGPPKITSEENAKAAFSAVSAALGSIDSGLVASFTSPLTVNGDKGTATITGTKTKSDNEYKSGSVIFNETKISVKFAGYAKGTTTLDGTVSYYYDYDFHSSYGYGSSSSETDLSTKGLALSWSDGAINYQDTVDIDAQQKYSNWNGSITASSGTTYKIIAW
jgi:hypothetical protein